jgi:alpha-tubulin suppressor-like RCC1 family protein
MLRRRVSWTFLLWLAGMPCGCSLILHSTPGKGDGDTEADVPGDGLDEPDTAVEADPDMQMEDEPAADPDLSDDGQEAEEAPSDGMDIEEESAPSLLTQVSAVSSGGNHTCALLETGDVLCWGGNARGQLGDGTRTDSIYAIAVWGLAGFTAGISAGSGFTCVVLSSGGIKCWGENDHGQIGNGSMDDQTVPVDVSGLSGAASLSLGLDHACAGNSSGAFCWGLNAYGQLGNGTTTDSGTPVEVTDIVSMPNHLGAGDNHMCLAYGGMVRCWGYNHYGQLADGTNVDRNVPTVGINFAGHTATFLTAGSNHTCAALSGGPVKCWGCNSFGQLGDRSTIDRGSPVDVLGLTNAAGLDAGGDFTCAVTSSGGVRCWGFNAFGMLGDGTSTDSNIPVDVTGLDGGVSSISSGLHHACAVLETGTVKCWGDNQYGQLGDGTNEDRWTPVDVMTR